MVNKFLFLTVYGEALFPSCCSCLYGELLFHSGQHIKYCIRVSLPSSIGPDTIASAWNIIIAFSVSYFLRKGFDKMDEVIVEREKMIALEPEKDRDQQKRKMWRPFSGCYKITISFLLGVLLSAFLIRLERISISRELNVNLFRLQSILRMFSQW